MIINPSTQTPLQIPSFFRVVKLLRKNYRFPQQISKFEINEIEEYEKANPKTYVILDNIMHALAILKIRIKRAITGKKE